MSLQLAPMTEADLPTWVTIESAAFADQIFTALMWPHGLSAADTDALIARNRDTLRTDPNTYFLKVTDPSTDAIIACAQWTRRPPRTPEELAKPYEFPTWSPGANGSVKEFFFGKFFRTRDEVMGEKPFWLLSILITHPEHQGRGAGSMLLKWGMEKADEDGWDCYLEASKKGRGLYEKYGFRAVKALETELGLWGRDGEWMRSTAMVRDAKGKS